MISEALRSVLPASASGFAIGISLILAIGAQNAFVLRQGLIGAHVFWICFLCAASDALLISAGVLLAAEIGNQAGSAVQWITWAGAAFLIVYGSMAAIRAFSPGRLIASERSPQALGRAILACLALTWLNPHVYFDTVGLIGAVSTGFVGPLEKMAFTSGAITASFVFFFSLGYGARLLAPIFSQPSAWAVLDLSVAFVMLLLALSLIATSFGGAGLSGSGFGL